MSLTYQFVHFTIRVELRNSENFHAVENNGEMKYTMQANSHVDTF